jgi:sarcosine oxidase
MSDGKTSPGRYDVAIVGLGAMGSMAAWILASRGKRVIGFDRFRPPHGMGSHAGLSRIIREAYYEQPYYIPVVQRAYELWAELERISGTPVYQCTGGLMIGEDASAIAGGAWRHAREYGVPFEILRAQEVRRRFPPLHLPESHVGIFERRAGILAPERAIESALSMAGRTGAELRFEEPVEEWTSTGTGITLGSAAGTYEAERVILAGGAWMATGLARIAAPLAAARQVLFWFEPKGGRDAFHPSRFPIFLWQWTEGHSIYGFPDQGEGFKVAIHHEGPTVNPDSVDRTVSAGEERELVEILERLIPDGVGPVIRSAVCLYTNTRDDDFILDLHPDDSRVIVASPCSGHGFKFAPAVGEILADLATTGSSRFDLSPFRLDRPDAFGPKRYTGAHG